METARSRLRRYNVENTPYFISTGVADGKPIFTDARKARTLVNVLYSFRQQGRYALLAFAIMPDHLHLLLVLRQGWDVSRIMHSIKRGSARLVNRERGRAGALWQGRFFDKAIRDEDELRSVVEYIHNNPVKAGLVEKPEDYQFSSANSTYETDLASYMGMDAQVGTTCATESGGKLGGG